MLSWKAKALPAALSVASALFSASLAQAACGSAGYSYAGVGGSDTVAGVAARITPLSSFDVLGGHVASYVGVGGVGLGPHGSTEWIQVGMSAFNGIDGHSIYYEVARPGGVPTYHEVATNLQPGRSHRVAVLEMWRRRNWWRVWVDGQPASKPIYLPASHKRWRPVATAESWGGGVARCNTYSYRFEKVSIARHPGGTWSRLDSGTVFYDPGYRVDRRALSSFVAARSPQNDGLPHRQTLSFRR